MAVTGADLLGGTERRSAQQTRVTGQQLLSGAQKQAGSVPSPSSWNRDMVSRSTVSRNKILNSGLPNLTTGMETNSAAQQREAAQDAALTQEPEKKQPAALLGDMASSLYNGRTAAGLDLMNTAQLSQFTQSDRALKQTLAMDQAEKALSAESAYKPEEWAAANYAMRALERAYPELKTAYNAAQAIQTPSRYDAAAAQKAREVSQSVPQEALDTYQKLANLPGMGLNTAANLVDTTFVGGGHQALGGLYSGAAWLDEAVTQNLFGQKDYESGLRGMAEGEYQEAAQKFAENTAGMSEGYKKLSGLGQNAGAMLMNSMMAGVATAGAMPAAVGTAAGSSALAGTGTKAAETLGNLGARAYNNILSNAGLYMNSANAGGQGIYQAYKAGASTGEQGAYGALTAAAEFASEKLFGGNPLFDQNAGAVNKLVGRVTQNPAVLGALSSVPAELFGEGLEESITAFFDPIWQWMTYRQGEDIDWATFDELADNFLSGVALAGMMQGGQAIINGVRTLPNPMAERNAARTQINDLESQLRTAAEQTIQAYEQAASAEAESRTATEETIQAYEPETRRPAAAEETARAADNAPVEDVGDMTAAELFGDGEDAAAKNENGLDSYTEVETKNLSASGKNQIIRNASRLKEFVQNALSRKNNTDRAYLGKVSNDVARRVQEATGLDISGYSAILTSDQVRHIMRSHGKQAKEQSRGQIAVTPDNMTVIADILANPDSVARSETTDGQGRPAILFQKQIGDNYVTVQGFSKGKKVLMTDTLYIQKRKNPQAVPTDATNSGPGDNVQTRTPLGSSVGEVFPASTRYIPQTGNNVNGFVLPSGASAPGQVNIDSNTRNGYNQGRNGGNANGREAAGRDYAAAEAGPGERVSALGESNPAVESQGNLGRGNSSESGRVRSLTDSQKTALREQGVADLGLRDSSGENALFSSSLEQAKQEMNPRIAWQVDPQDSAALDAEGSKTFLADNNLSGVAVKPDGDIVGVFKSGKERRKGASTELLLTAIENGGTKLDCFNTFLPGIYEQLGFEPVAWMEFSTEYAPDGWDPAYGTPEVVFMAHNGDSVDTVIRNRKQYKDWSDEEIRALPKFDDYDAAYAYRDSVLAQRQSAREQAMQAPGNERLTQRTGNAARKEGGAVETWEHARKRQGPRSEFFENTLRRTIGKETLNDVAADLNAADEVPSDVTWANRLDSGEYFKYAPRTEAEQNAWAQEQVDIAIEGAQRANPNGTEAEHRWEAYRDLMNRLERKQGWDAFDVKLASLVEDYLTDAFRSVRSDVENDFFPKIDDDEPILAKALSDFLRLETKEISGAGATLQAVAERTRGTPETRILTETEKLLQQATEEGSKRLTDEAYMDVFSAAADATARIKQSAPNGPTALETVQEALSPWDLETLEMVQHQEGKTAETLRENILSKLDSQTRETYDRALAQEDAGRQQLIDLILETSTRRGTNRMIANEKGVSRALKRALEHQNYDFLRALASAQTIDLARDYVRISWGRKVKGLQVLAHLLNPRTGLRNQISNTVFSGIDSLAVEPGVLLDMALSKRTGTRSRSADQSRFSPEKRAGVRSAGEKAYIQTALDTAMDDATNAFGQGASRNFKMNAGPVSRFLSSMSKWLGYSLNVTDARAKGGHEAEAMRQLRALEEAGKLRADVTEEDLRQTVQQEARYRTFQDDSRISRMSKGAHDVLNNIGTKEFGLGDVLIPYAKTPGNLVSRAVEYSPVGAAKGMVQVLKALKDGQNVTVKQQRAAVDSLSRGMTGTGLIALFTAAALKGLIRTAEDEDDKDAAAMNAAAGLSGTQWNLSATLRAMSGKSTEWQDGDTLIGMSFMEPLSVQMAVGTALAKEIQDAQAQGESFNAVDAAIGSMNGIMQELMNMPAFTGLSTIVDAYRYSDADSASGKAADAVLNTVVGLPASFVPSPVRQIAQGTDGKYRDLYSADTGNVFANTALGGWSAFANNIPGLRQTLPVKQDNFGRDKEYAGGAVQNFLNSTVMPGSVNTYSTGAVEDELRSLAATTGNVAVYPNRKAADSFTYDGETYQLNYADRRAYQEVYGDAFYQTMEGMLESDYYNSLTAQEEVKMVQQAKTYAAETAKADYLDGRYESGMLDGVAELEAAGLGFADWYEWHEKKAALSGDDMQSQILAQLDRSGLSDEQAAAVYAGACGYSVSDKKAEEGRKAGIDSDTLALWRYRFDQAGREGSGNEEKRQMLFSSSLPVQQKNALDEIFLTDGVYIPRERDVDYSSEDSFWITQMSDSGQSRWNAWVDGQLSAKEWYDLYSEFSGESKTTITAELQQRGWSAGDAAIIAGWIKGRVTG